MSDLNDLLTFRKMITPTIIQVIFWIGIIACAIGGIVGIVTGAIRNTATGVLSGLAILIIGPLAVRVYCEALILVFRINDTLTEISDKMDRQQSDDR